MRGFAALGMLVACAVLVYLSKDALCDDATLPPGPACPCGNQTICDVVNSTKQEVIAFVSECNKTVWSQFDWSRLTSIILVDFNDTQLYCYAHERNVAVSYSAKFPASLLANSTEQGHWIKKQLTHAESNFLDGVNIDFDAPVDRGSAESRALVQLVDDTAVAFHTLLPGSQVTFNAPWSPNGVDGRFYNYSALANASDFLLIKAYDQQKDSFERPCAARPNADFFKMSEAGIRAYLDLGIEGRRLALTVPWFGYDYSCLHMTAKNSCLIEDGRGKGSRCSGSVATRRSYAELVRMIDANATLGGILWNNDTLTPYFNYKQCWVTYTYTTAWNVGQAVMELHQVHFDNPKSLAFKYSLAMSLKLRGIAVWTANDLGYEDHLNETVTEMWGALPHFKDTFACPLI
ncbi:unnamed protein product [Ixodes hexagonus]